MAANNSSCAVWVRRQPSVMPLEFGIHQDGAVAVVPGQAQQAGLAGAVLFEAFGERGDGGSGAARDGVEDIAGGGESRFDAGEARDERSRGPRRTRRESDWAASPIAMMQVEVPTTLTTSPESDTRADGVPVRVERADGNRDAGAQAEASRPTAGVRWPAIWSEVEVASAAVCRAMPVSSGSTDGREIPRAGSRPAPRSTSICGPWRRCCAARLGGIVDAAEHGGHHVAMFEARWRMRSRLSGLWRSQCSSLAKPHSEE